VLALAILAVGIPARANAQAVYGSISGIITDASGAVVRGASDHYERGAQDNRRCRDERVGSVLEGTSAARGGRSKRGAGGVQLGRVSVGPRQAMARVRARLAYIIPLTLFIVSVLLYLNTRSLVKTAIVLLAVPFSAVGAIWYLYLLGYNTSIAVWVGLIALLGVDAETGVFMLLYLDLAYEKASRDGRLQTLADLQAAIVEGAAKRLRPKFMTVATMFVGLIPIMWATGTGSDVWKRIAAPMAGGIFTSFVLEFVVYPAIYEIWKWHFEMKRAYAEPQPAALGTLPSLERVS
jgi:AcrB/AcrD/AcrF family